MMSKKDDKWKEPKRTWQKVDCPMRKIFLWGWDNENNPSFLALYGEHERKKGSNYELKDTVTYTDSIIFRGKQGHFPSFEAVKILNKYNYKIREYTKHMYYKKDIEGSYWSYAKEEDAIKEFRIFNSNEAPSFPYFEEMTQKDYVKVIEKNKLKFDNFKLAKEPKEVLNLDDELIPYADEICAILGTPNLYKRKKYFKELIELNPPQKLYEFILKHGSSELIAGLFLEFALSKNDMLLKEAKEIVDSEINWVSESYAKGLKRCASLYVNSLEEETKKKRIEFIRETLPDMDLHLLSIDGREIEKDKILEGKDYREYAIEGFLGEYFAGYSYAEEEWIEKRNLEHYKKSYYSDGVVLHTNHLKNTIQEAEIYGLADVIGKIAYYLDAPRLHYHFKANGNSKGLLYFKKYLRRRMDFYARNDTDKFMEAMKALFTSYTNADYLCKFKGNFQFNYYIKHYLYYDFKEKAPECEWDGRKEWISNDQLRNLEGRYEFMPEVWDKHFNDVIDIMADSKIEVILKAFYYIIKDSFDEENLKNIPYEKLIKLADCSYEPAADLFAGILSKKLEGEKEFTISMMFCLMHCSSSKIHKMALEYWRRKGGEFSVNHIIELLFFNNFEEWTDLFRQSIQDLEKEELVAFIKEFFNYADKFAESNMIFSEEVKNVLFEFAENFNFKLQYSNLQFFIVSRFQKLDMLSFMVSKLCDSKQLSSFLLEFAEKIIFSISYEELKDILADIEINDDNRIISQKCKLIICFLKAIKENTIPSDSQIIEILESGTAGMLKAAVDVITQNRSKLTDRFSTLLILLESDVMVLNEISKSIFEALPKKEQKKLHFMIINSPDKKVYSYGLQKLCELYGDRREAIPLMALSEINKSIFEALSKEEQKKFYSIILDPLDDDLYKLYENLKETILQEFIIQMLEHPAVEVRSYISNKITKVLHQLGNENQELFMYYVKTLLFLPNKASAAKKSIYKILPLFVKTYPERTNEVEEMLLEIGGSNIILDSEMALVTLAEIKKEVIPFEG